jgi:primosomal replication protein N
MFLDQKLKSIQADKNRLATCSDLRRQMVYIEVLGVGRGVRRTISNLTRGLVVAESIFGFLSEHKKKQGVTHGPI